ncbi:MULTISPECIES: polysaccharide deacetylase family protein [unclassified Duganella]|uniref:polysaccharide deacetylase family protein n=1 Tax=unclassified Duganella TaxID=2636909 RepID=UPI000886B204|nr:MULTISPECIES: polysaccharide deacetylase family protein [unclassified Duganella]SDH23272.1 Peptidoglycan/xylan/chitin deacetylase, PgdA/CDA1 family [Duganella sp. OV458]SDK45251.1 Peptidoglycan/xylan/chitin deacetylase, PgdA/CDA1 family [Duganella sp. OV510]
MKSKLMIAAVVAALAAGGAYVALRGKPESAPVATNTAAVPALLPELQALLANYRKIIVLLADEKTLNDSERKAANQVGQSLFHENLERLAHLQPLLVQAQALPPAQRDAADDALLSYIESAPDLYDADRLAFREVLLALQKLAAADQTLPAIKLHKRVSEDLAALEDIEKQYDKEISDIFSRFEARAITPKREKWEDYVAHLRKLYSREQIMKDYGVILPYPEPPAAAAPAKEIFGNALPPKTVVLTFDDGPHGSYTEEIAAILKQYNVPGVFFEVGQNVSRYKGESKRLIDAGHTVGNHSYSHALLSKQTGDKLYGEIANADNALKAADERRSPLFRFPYGARNAEGMAVLSRLGLRSVMWNVDSMDWADPVPSSIANRVLTTLNKEQRGIILFHDIHDRSVKALPMVLDKLIADGYSFAGWDGQDFKVAKGAPQPEPEKIAVSTGYANSYAVVIGINDYQKWPKLQYAVQDAKAIRETLVGKFGFDNERVFTLTNGEATRNNILAVFHDKLAEARLKKDDRIFVFFAGHGATRQLSSGRNLGYIIPADSDPQQVSVDAIPMTDLQNIAESLNAKHVFFVMDACYSGLGLTRGGGSNAFLRDNARRIGRQMLTAGGADQMVADGGPGGHSVFTWTLLQALNGKADLNGDGLITATELAAYVAPAVSSVSQQTPAFGSLPGSEGGEFVFQLPVEAEFLSAQSAQLPADAIALNSKLDSGRSQQAEGNAVVIKNLQGGEQKIAAPKPVDASARQLAQRANDKGLQLYKEKQYAQAEAAFTEALKYRPDFGLAANNLGFVYYKQEKYAEAARWFENTVQIDASRAIAYLNLGDARMKLADADKARKAYASFIELAPNHPSAAYAREQLKKL